MKKKLRIITFSCVLLVLTAILALILLAPNKQPDQTVGGSSTTSVIPLREQLTSLTYLEIVLPSIETSYANLCALDYVEKPVKRTVDEAIKKIEGMLEEYPELSVVLENVTLYPDELLKSVAANPEMVHFAVNYLDYAGTIIGGFREEEKPEDYPLFLQWDIRWGYMQYGSKSNVGSSGCGPACLAMAVYYLTGSTDCTPDAIAQYSLEKRYYIEGTGTAWALLDSYPTLYGLKVTHPSLSEANLKAQLDKGSILICSCKPGDFTPEGHFIVIYGYDENGFKINDPKCVYRSRQTWTYDQIKDDIKRTWSISK